MLIFFVSFAAFLLLKNLGVRPFLWLGYLPVFDQVWSLRWSAPAWTFAVAAAGALGLEIIIANATVYFGGDDRDGDGNGEDEVRRGLFRSPLADSVVGVVTVFGLCLAVQFIPVVQIVLGRKELFSSIMEPFVMPSILGSSVVTVITSLGAALAVVVIFKWYRRSPYGGVWCLVAVGALELWWSVPRGYDPSAMMYKWVPYGVGLFASMLLLLSRYKNAASIAGVFLIATLVLDSVSVNGYPDRRDPFTPAPYVEHVLDEGGAERVVGINGNLFPNFAGALGLYDLRYVNALTIKAYHDFRKNHLHADLVIDEPVTSLWFTGRGERYGMDGNIDDAGGEVGGSNRVFYRPPVEDIEQRAGAYSFMGVRYVVAGESTEEIAGYGLVYDGEVRVFENEAALPRAFVADTYEVRFAGPHDEVQREAAVGGFDPSRGLIADSGEGYFVDVLSEESRAEGKGAWRAADIVDYSPNRVVIEAESEGPGMLVLTDVFYPGWRATVNGERARIHRVNGLVRGVMVGGGRSEVVFSYMPPSFIYGSLAAVLAVVLSAVILIGGRFYARR
jgi:hypothetical protein